MPVQPKRLMPNKSMWKQGRINGYYDWQSASMRELVQNSVDAGADRIDFTITEGPGHSSFGRTPRLERVVRLVCQDNGHGMSEDVLANVFLNPGESTKNEGGFQGGFGTARNMLCYSHVRYSIRTLDQVVEGDGSEYELSSVEEALAANLEQTSQAVANGDLGLAALLREQHAQLVAGGDFTPGCRMEIDMDPQESAYSSANPDVERLTQKLQAYLDMSQIAAKVSINGVEYTGRTLKGPVRRRLMAPGPDGTEVEFATVHTSQGERANFKGKLVVRAAGAAMYTESVSLRDQVVVEIAPQLSRLVLTDDRGGMKSPYRDVLSAYLRELAVDSRSALETRDNRRYIKVDGGRGALVAHATPPAPDLGADGPVVAPVEVEARVLYTTPAAYRASGYAGASPALVDALLEAVAAGQDTFVAAIAAEHRDQALAFETAVRAGGGAGALALLSPELGTAIGATLVARQAQATAREVEDARFRDINDVHIQVEDLGDNNKLREAVRRYTPGYWRRQGEHLEGRGMAAHMLLSAWTSCCQEAMATLLAIHPTAAPAQGLKYATGFYFKPSQPRWGLNGMENRRSEGQHQEREGTHLLLLNPVSDDGQPAFDLAKSRRANPADPVGGLQDLEALACHQVAHVLESVHDEDYSTLLTQLCSMFNRARAHERMRETVDATRVAYGRGKARIQAMDAVEDVVVLEAEVEGGVLGAGATAGDAQPAQPTQDKPPRRRGAGEPRPARVLLAHALPTTTIVAGALSAPENEHLVPSALKDIVGGSIEQISPGVVEVDCDRLQVLETDLTLLADNGWDLDALALPSPDELQELGGASTPEDIVPPAPPEPPTPEVILEPESLPAPESTTPAEDVWDLGALALPSAEELQSLDAGEPAVQADTSVGVELDLGLLDLDALDLGDLGTPEPAAAKLIAGEPETASFDLGFELPEVGELQALEADLLRVAAEIAAPVPVPVAEPVVAEPVQPMPVAAEPTKITLERRDTTTTSEPTKITLERRYVDEAPPAAAAQARPSAASSALADLARLQAMTARPAPAPAPAPTPAPAAPPPTPKPPPSGMPAMGEEFDMDGFGDPDVVEATGYGR